MLASIHPLGERARNNRWWRTATAYLAGSLGGGLAIGGLAGSIGSLGGYLGLEPRVAVALAVVLCVFTAVVEAGWVSVRLPGPRRQVNEDWLDRYRGWVYGVGFGAQLGTGVLTAVTTPTVLLMLTLAVLSGSTGAGVMIGGTFGLVRALPLIGMAPVRDAQQLRRAHRRLHASAGIVRHASVGTLGVVSIGLVVV